MGRRKIDHTASAWFWGAVVGAALPASGLIGLAMATARSAPPQGSVLGACVIWMQGHAGQGLLGA